MFKSIVASVSVGAILCLGTESGVAHHSVLINFDRQAVTEVSGTVSAVYLRNPHSQYVLDVTEDDGSVTEWFIEWADRNALTRRGVDLDLIQIGDIESDFFQRFGVELLGDVSLRRLSYL